MRETGNVLGEMKPSVSRRGAELMFRAAETLGNSVFRREEIRTAITA